YVTNTVHGTAHPCVGKRMQPSPGGKCCAWVSVLTRRIHNVQPNPQSPILSAACVD
uniref:Long intergenic non-protein coding RNA 3041 n=1 Tax=Microcebus murinus TaxID=30608 RepID=A0A8C5V336_MICMU